MSRLRLTPLALLLFVPFAVADEPAELSVEQVVEKSRSAVVVITTRGREGRRESLGTGFIIRPDGLIATNYHVIGDGRAIAVEMSDGKRFDVKTVVATDRTHDLALLQIDGKSLPSLDLGNSDKLRDGQGIVALGNPQGLKNSVVSGIVSGKREIDGKSMIQLAIPLEPGNSGGPLLDLRGKVQGVLTMKSLVTANLGFAMPINKLKPLIEKPNPIAMDKWMTLGTLDADEWKPYLGARWTQRAGRMRVEGAGTGFGGRSMCIWQKHTPDLPFEIAVQVKLDDERGAAGIVFHSDNEQKHYGFYPTAGGVRLTRFDGPDVLSWKILDQKNTPHYLPGEFNALRVSVTEKGIKCYVNDHLVIESEDIERTSGQVGIVKFRDTIAEYKGFRVAKEIGTQGIPAEMQQRVLKNVEKLDPRKPTPADLLKKLTPDDRGADILRERAQQLEAQATQLRELATQLHQQRVLDLLAKELAKKEDAIDLVRCALLLAKLDNEEIDIDAYSAFVQSLGKKLKGKMVEGIDDAGRLKVLNQFFFEDRGFHGSHSDYYHRSNSYLSDVLDDREGLPITLSILYVEIGRIGGVKLAGIGLPGHFVVRQITEKKDGPFIDVFEQGKTFDEDEAKTRIQDRLGEAKDELMEPMPKKLILHRVIRNLLNVAQEEKDMDAALRYLDVTLTILPDSGTDRFLRAALRFQKGLKVQSLEDVEYLLEHPSDEIDPKRLQQLRRALVEGM